MSVAGQSTRPPSTSTLAFWHRQYYYIHFLIIDNIIKIADIFLHFRFWKLLTRFPDFIFAILQPLPEYISFLSLPRHAYFRNEAQSGYAYFFQRAISLRRYAMEPRWHLWYAGQWQLHTMRTFPPQLYGTTVADYIDFITGRLIFRHAFRCFDTYSSYYFRGACISLAAWETLHFIYLF